MAGVRGRTSKIMVLPGVRLAALLVALTGFLLPSEVEADVLSDARWRFRLVVVTVAAEDDPLRLAQRAIVDQDSAGWRERRMRLLEVVGDRVICSGRPINAEAAAIRAALALPPTPGTVQLIGLDGQVKVSQSDAATNEQLFALIDAMPMRQAERGAETAPLVLADEDGC